MAPLLLLFLLGGLCAIFSLTSSSRASSKKRDDAKSGDQVEAKAAEDGGGQEKKPRPGPEADLAIVFSTFDHDGDGFITAVELEESLRRLGIAVSADEAAAMVARVDANSDGLIDINEFRDLYGSIPKKRRQEKLAAGDGDSSPAVVEDEEAEEEDERDLREAFDVFDDNKDGLISAEELGTVLGSLGLRRAGSGRPAAAECRDMIRLVDSDGDGMVSFEEFKQMMTVVKA
jgi:Ca2+-binding EF-hand superfamily protein